MEYRPLGTSSLTVSELGLGGNTFGPPRIDEAMTHRVIHAAIDMGINFLDTAYNYNEGKSEEFVGTALEGKRDQVLIATKFHLRELNGQTAHDRILEHFHTSLRRLRTDYVDLYQIHVPSPAVPQDEILRTMDDLVREGKVREIGCCNYASWRLAEAMFTARTLGTKQFIADQIYYNLLRRQIEQELVPFCAKYQISIIPYHPLSGGFLTGKYRPGEPPPPGTRGAAGSPIVKQNSTERNFALLPPLEQFAQERDHTVGELAIAWLLANQSVGSVITGVSNPDQLAQNARATGWKLTPEEKKMVDAITLREGDDRPVESPR